MAYHDIIFPLTDFQRLSLNRLQVNNKVAKAAKMNVLMTLKHGE